MYFTQHLQRLTSKEKYTFDFRPFSLPGRQILRWCHTPLRLIHSHQVTFGICMRHTGPNPVEYLTL